ncbi:MAG: hypothetical protein KatS3mg031_0183 [Chitinophagales bacterium]|nr:MAG: hypothetical protein KatS3mg031_0183 [Chitinophagales bacterium]
MLSFMAAVCLCPRHSHTTGSRAAAGLYKVVPAPAAVKGKASFCAYPLADRAETLDGRSHR